MATFAGGPALVRALRQLPRVVRQRVLVGAMLAGSSVVQRRAIELAPRDAAPRRRQGKRLADTIKVRVTEQLPSAVATNVTTNDPRAHLVEYGHQNVPRGPTRERVSITTVRISKRTGKQIVRTRLDVDPSAKPTRRSAGATGFTPPKPFMRRAWEEKKERALKTIAHVLEAGIEAEARRLAGPGSSGGFATAPGITGAV